jgi:hypothetical protein
MATVGFVLLMAAPALAHVCFVAEKPEGKGSAGTATLVLDVAEDGTELDVAFPGDRDQRVARLLEEEVLGQEAARAAPLADGRSPD